MELPFNVSETGYYFWGVTDASNLYRPAHMSHSPPLIHCVGGSNWETKASVRRLNLLLTVNVGDDYTPLSHLWQPLSSDCWLFDIVTYSHSSSDALPQSSLFHSVLFYFCCLSWDMMSVGTIWMVTQLFTHCNSHIKMLRVTGSLPDLTA